MVLLTGDLYFIFYQTDIMKPDKNFLEAIKAALLLHLEDEVRNYCVNQDLDLIEDHDAMCDFYEYAHDQLFLI